MNRYPFARRGRGLAPGQRAELTVIDTQTGERHIVLVADEVIEAPNWTPDGRALIFNAGGHLYSVAADGSGGPVRIDTGHLADLNNDHVISHDGRWLFVSSDDGHLYKVPSTGGKPVRISNDHATPFHYYLHGISPDGETLAYVAIEREAGRQRTNLFLIASAGGPDIRLTDDDFPVDGPEFSPDGQWLYFNCERARTRPGHAQIFRMRLSDRMIEQLTFDDRVNWFPHPAPDGTAIVYLSYPPGTTGHPADRPVILRLMAPDGGRNRDLVDLFGGQGTINVNSWAPDSRRLAYVAYPMAI